LEDAIFPCRDTMKQGADGRVNPALVNWVLP
jgi:hypothetical protein